jgi:predicted O-linked N-acetylglucosamine transferase (SPINDLY family)
VDRFRDLTTASIATAAETIHSDGIDVLVDLDGFTRGHRSAILALRPAPIQVAYLGFPGTLGAPYMDYIIADRVVAPPEHADDFAERIVRLPECYQVNSDRGVLAAPPLRERLGLPADGFVFACFNVSRKVDPHTFGAWLRILARVPGAVLWLLADGDEALVNLRAEAGKKGVAPERLIPAPRLDPAAHLARCQSADLFLDTLICNAHTTASDALWADLPVLTCPGRSFAARVAASIVGAAGLGDLVCESVAAYEERAVALAADKSAMMELRARLAAGRDTCALFDTARFVRGLEAAFAEMVRRRSLSAPAEAIDVADLA